MKIKFDADDDLPLNKPLKLHMLTIIVRSVFLFLKKTVNFTCKFIKTDVCMSYKMLQYEKTDVSEGIDINKTSASKECMLFHYWYFKDLRFKFELHVCNKCHNVFMTAYELEDIEILNEKGLDYRCILQCISKNEAVNRLNNSVLDNKGVL